MVRSNLLAAELVVSVQRCVGVCVYVSVREEERERDYYMPFWSALAMCESTKHTHILCHFASGDRLFFFFFINNAYWCVH